jgi:hypothetical protein
VEGSAIKITQRAKESIRDINDVNRMIKNKAKYFKTLYIRFLGKSDVVLDKEVTDMVNNLRTYGAKTTAKASSI